MIRSDLRGVCARRSELEFGDREQSPAGIPWLFTAAPCSHWSSPSVLVGTLGVSGGPLTSPLIGGRNGEKARGLLRRHVEHVGTETNISRTYRFLREGLASRRRSPRRTG